MITIVFYSNASALARNGLLAAVLYPDTADSTDSAQFWYNLQSEVDVMQDQNGTIHQYLRDLLGRQTSDQAVVLGAGVYGNEEGDIYAVLRIDTAYEIRGMVSQLTSYLNIEGTSTANQISLSFGDFEQLTAEQQNLSGSSGPNLTVNYTTGEGGTNNSIRPLTVVYPYGSTTLAYGYGTAGGDDDGLGRATSISFNSVVVATYAYFGLGSFASVTYGTSTPPVVLTLASGATYTPGFDQFGRVTDVPWTQTSGGTVTTLANLAYGYNLASSRTYRQDVKAAATGYALSENYGYDGIRRLILAARGKVASGGAPVTSLALQQNWTLDATGNWSGFSNIDLVTAANCSIQQRTSNAANEIVDVAATVNTAWATPAYDRNGNMTSIPAPAALADACPARFDAWNRLVTFDNTATSVATIYGYDGLHRRAFLDVGGTFRYFIYSDQWQVLEEYAGEINRRYVWGLRYVDDLVLRDRTNIAILVERMYVLQDANWNVVAIFNPAAGEGGVGAVYERYAYTAYGVCQILGPGFAPLPSSYYDWTVLYTGRVLDDESGLYYYRRRYYQSGLGVFVSRDPVGHRDGFNCYRYSNDSPTNAVDPTGMWLTLSGCSSCPAIASAAARVNVAIGMKGACRNWFLAHGWNGKGYAASPDYTVTCHSRWKIMCALGFPSWTLPAMGIGVCLCACNDFNDVGWASLLVHELGHHFCPLTVNRETCAISAQTACGPQL